MRPIRLLAPLALLGLAACGGPLFSAEVVIDRFCTTQSFPTMPPVPPTGPLTVGISYQVQLPPLLRSKGSEVVLRLLDLGITATSAGTDLSPVSHLDVLLSGSTPTLLARYDRPASHPVPMVSLTAQGQGVDLASVAPSGTLPIQFDFTTDGLVSGSPPPSSWSADIQVCFYGRTVISYF